MNYRNIDCKMKEIYFSVQSLADDYTTENQEGHDLLKTMSLLAMQNATMHHIKTE